MPVLKDFGGFKIRMYVGDENPPHVNVQCPNFDAKVSIRDAAVFKGEIDRKIRDEALDWIAENLEMLDAKWTEFKK
jgi:hypothetical protein